MSIEGICTRDIEGIERPPRRPVTIEDLRAAEQAAAEELLFKIAIALEAEKRQGTNRKEAGNE